MWIKVCGVTTPDDAIAVAAEGVDALGLNFVPSSPRHLTASEARSIVRAVRGQVELIGVVADLSISACEELFAESGVDSLQLHGSESPAFQEMLGGRAFKAIGIAQPEDVERARAYGGERLLVDASVGGRSGGVGIPFEWSWVTDLVHTRKVIVAGGLGPANVAQAVAALHPFGVDVASGVELDGNKRRKDPAKVAAFVRAARAAAEVAYR